MTSTYPVWGWARDPAEAPTRDAVEALRPLVTGHLRIPITEATEEPAPLKELRADRVTSRLPESLRAIASADPINRARHGLGRSYRDIVRGIRGMVPYAPDVVVRPTDEAQVVAVLDWCSGAGVAVIPYGGGTSVVGGVEPRCADTWPGVVSLDLERLSGVVEVDAVSRAARVRAGTDGPALEHALAEHGLTARFYPQSFERSTVGGWIVTRAAGHFSTQATHIDDLVESIRALTPTGEWESRRLPGSGAGPSPDRMLLGSEGSLGVVTEAWLRVQPRPTHRWAATLAAPTFKVGCEAIRAVMHAGLFPATCRLVDAEESRATGTLDTGEAALLLGFESFGGPVDAEAATALDLCADAGLRVVESGNRGGASQSWRSAFTRAPYVREQLILLGVMVETFETAITWDRLDDLVESVTAATRDAVTRICGSGTVTCRLTHVYRDGAAPYFTVFAPARRGSEIAQWDEVKAAASDAILAAGATITHHHATGRDHRPWYDAQRPDPFARAFAAAKAAVDPGGILNPGVIVGA